MIVHQKIADELKVHPQQVRAAIELLDGGATVPFIARYRKEVTQGLDDTQLRQLEERLYYLRELDDRRDTVLNSIREQGKLTPELERDIVEADNKTRLEDLYAPFKPKRRTKGQIAKEAGLEPLANLLFADPQLQPEVVASEYVNVEAGVADVAAALEGARYILMERFAEDAQLLQQLRSYMGEHGQLQVKVVVGKEQEGSKFLDYFDFQEALCKIPSHSRGVTWAQ
jgi:protein Tex